ncbi:MAG: hypothetical protein IH586_23505 [Anaerolineaceae bacterium]|nr:hypothetical protein [Anaerolineaceae bacterium]
MNDNLQDNSQTQNPTNNPPLSRHEERQMRREARREARYQSGGAWIGGAVLIGLGIIILMQNFGALYLQNWWALFILIPAVGAFGNTWRAYQGAGGRMTAQARGSLIGGLVLSMVAVIFLFNLSWGLLGPAILVLAGVGILINALLPG